MIKLQMTTLWMAWKAVSFTVHVHVHGPVEGVKTWVNPRFSLWMCLLQRTVGPCGKIPATGTCDYTLNWHRRAQWHRWMQMIRRRSRGLVWSCSSFIWPSKWPPKPPMILNSHRMSRYPIKRPERRQDASVRVLLCHADAWSMLKSHHLHRLIALRWWYSSHACKAPAGTSEFQPQSTA